MQQQQHAITRPAYVDRYMRDSSVECRVHRTEEIFGTVHVMQAAVGHDVWSVHGETVHRIKLENLTVVIKA